MDKRLLNEKEADNAIHETYADFPVWYRVAKAQLLKADKAKLDRPELEEQIYQTIKQHREEPIGLIASHIVPLMPDGEGK